MSQDVIEEVKQEASPVEVTPETPKKKTTDEILAEIYGDFEANFKIVKSLTASASANTLKRVLEAVVSFPVHEQSISKVKKYTKEYDLFMAALICARATRYISSILEKDKQVKEELNKRLEEGDNNVSSTEETKQ